MHSMPCRNPCRLYVHLAFTCSLRWSLKCSVNRTWTNSAFSINENAWSVMVTGSQSHVWSGIEQVQKMWCVVRMYPKCIRNHNTLQRLILSRHRHSRKIEVFFLYQTQYLCQCHIPKDTWNEVWFVLLYSLNSLRLGQPKCMWYNGVM